MIRIAFMGPMASGKTTYATQLVEQYPHVERLSFADPVKHIATQHFGMAAHKKDRALLQTIGMTGRIIHPDTWVHRLTARIHANQSYVVDDVRFPNESKALRQLGFTIVWLQVPEQERIQRLRAKHGDQQAREHIRRMDSVSECSMDMSMADVVWRCDSKTNLLKFLLSSKPAPIKEHTNKEN